jgi:hypothetical protein
MYILAINGGNPFFLEFNMDNSSLLLELIYMSVDKIIKVYDNLDVFDAKCVDYKNRT